MWLWGLTQTQTHIHTHKTQWIKENSCLFRAHSSDSFHLWSSYQEKKIIIIILSHLFRSNFLCSKVIMGIKKEQAQNIWNILQEIKAYYKQTEYTTTTKMLLRLPMKILTKYIDMNKNRKQGRKEEKKRKYSLHETGSKSRSKNTKRAIEI